MGIFENNSGLVATVVIFRCHGWRNAYSATRGSGIRIPPTRVAECGEPDRTEPIKPVKTEPKPKQ